ncbi:motility associated factor glycosyltransferase family protein, partial [Campylobacter jejuni]|nr:motility associated factor glycosyltransferase family protein [Campylobacter jejuni]
MDGKGEKVRKKEINFEKNIKALSGSEYDNLRKKLQDLKELKHFSFTQGKDNLDINIIKKRNLKKMYQDPIKELEKNLEYFKDFTRYPVLFFYGIGNGILYKILLQNQALKRIIIFEKELELIFLAFNFVDFSKDLSLARLIIVHQDDVTLPKIEKIFRLVGDLFYRSYNLHLANDFYEHYKEDILKLNKLNMQTIKNHNLMHGNDPKDAMQGIEQFVYNLPQMITHPSYKELLSKRKGISDTAIIVSTGPSLTKQLPLLKKYASKATIFCADSSYPILAKHGIKPDYVLSLERIPLTSEFFNNDFGEFDQDVLFVCISWIYPQTIKYLQKNKRAFILTSRPSSFIENINLCPYGYVGYGPSVAHMAYEFATHLNYKNIIFIGQDLAYAKDGFSHTKDYKNLDKHEGHFRRDKGKFQCLAYGGNGKVESSEIWTMFRFSLQNTISKNIVSTTYNCTEGGARIEGTIEKPFLWACENLLDKDLNKPFEKLEPLSLNKQNEFLLKAYYKVCKSIKHCRDFNKILSNDFENIQSIYLSLNEKEEYLNLAIEKIDKFKNKLEDIKQMQDLYDILQSLFIQFELN